MVLLLRALVVALALSLSTGGALPLWAHLAGVEGPHVCHCSAEKHDCVCPKCNIDQRDEMLVSGESLSGRCGDDDVAFGGKALLAVLEASCLGSLSAARAAIAPPTIHTFADLVRAPETPPPRARSSSV